MASARERNAMFDRSEDDTVRSEKNTTSLECRYDGADFRDPFRISWIVILTAIASILLLQPAVTFAENVLVSTNEYVYKYLENKFFYSPRIYYRERIRYKKSFLW